MNKLFTFVFGAALGAVGGLLFAPRTGEETRNIVVDRANTIASDAQEFSAQAAEKVQDVMKQATDKGVDVANSVKNNVNAGVKEAVDKNDELREKIEAARERIAAQVKQNASDVANSVKNDAPEVGDKVKDAADKATDAVVDAVDQAADKAKDSLN